MQTKMIPFWGLALGAISISVVSGVRAEERSTVLAVMEADQPHGVLRTLDGRMYLGVRDTRADQTGLTFRHQGGAAKVLRNRLSQADQKRFSVPEEVAPSPAPVGEPLAWASADPQPVGFPSLVFTYRVRAILPPPTVSEAQSCASALSHHYWPSHWSRPHYGLAYPLFPCRQMAERDFLISTGILPRPPGVWPWRLR